MSSRIPAAIALMALTCSVWLTGYSLTHQVHGAPVRLPRSHAETDEEKADRMFPDGKSHDFGKIQRGTFAKHAFRIVNTSDAPIRVGAISISMGSLTAYATKSEIQPNEQAEIEITVDTRRFVGERTQALFVTLEMGNKRYTEARFWVKANSQDSSRP
jgi:hypothetical protein